MKLGSLAVSQILVQCLCRTAALPHRARRTLAQAPCSAADFTPRAPLARQGTFSSWPFYICGLHSAIHHEGHLVSQLGSRPVTQGHRLPSVLTDMGRCWIAGARRGTGKSGQVFFRVPCVFLREPFISARALDYLGLPGLLYQVKS